MSKASQISLVEDYFKQFAPLVAMLRAVIETGYVDAYDDYESFKARIDANTASGRDTTLFGFLPVDSENGRQNALYIYLPGICIGWIPLSVVEDLRP